MKASTILYKHISEAALSHGNDGELDMEVGDLQCALMAAMEVLTPEQIKGIIANKENDINSLILEHGDIESLEEEITEHAPEMLS